ncbi:MAG: hypothetical protein ACRCZO_15020 [Cetobacterium sp.]
MKPAKIHHHVSEAAETIEEALRNHGIFSEERERVQTNRNMTIEISPVIVTVVTDIMFCTLSDNIVLSDRPVIKMEV